MAHTMVSVATGVLCPVIGKLSTLLQMKYNRLKGVDSEILSLKDELSSMNALLLKLEDIDDLDIQVKEWRDQIRELSYDIEDRIDYFMFQVDGDAHRRESMKGFLQKSIRQLRMLRARDKMADQIIKLKARVDMASERRKRYNFDETLSSSIGVVPIDPRLPALYVEEENLVGIDTPRVELIRFLTEGDDKLLQKLQVVSIVGIGGLGKTTLARQVYGKISGQFDCQAFVSVSQKPDIRKIFKNILINITELDYGAIDAWDEERLINKLREFLNDKRYFVVIDDIWSTTVWTTIRCAFCENYRGSKILCTTRIISVAETCCSADCKNIYEMKPLSDVYAEKLFIKRIFGSEDQCPAYLKDIYIDILRRCGGLPLAIISLASLLATKPRTKEQWGRYRNSVCSATENVPSVSNMQRILSLSYNDLPHYLKTCLLYLSTFPEDVLILRDPLVRRWIAEGFVTAQGEGGRTLEEVGECYFNELINRSMIQPEEIQYDGQAHACRMHDMILDLIISKSVVENFITSFSHNYLLGCQDKVIRRLSLDCRERDAILPATMVLSSARSLVVYGSTEHIPLISAFHVLRTIAIESNDKLKNCYLRDIGRLFQLKCLRLREVGISELPEEIGELQELQTLELQRTRIKELPKSIVRLKNLVFLVADGITLPEGIGNMRALQKLIGVKVDISIPVDCLRELGGLNDLRCLYIIWCVSDAYPDKKTYTDSFVSCIDELCTFKLRYLQLGCDDSSLDFMLDSWSHPPYPLYNFQMITYYCFPIIPEWMATLFNVAFLDINVTSVGKDVLRILGDLPSLLSLSITTKTIVSERLVFGSNGFQCLKEFDFHSWQDVLGPLLFEVGAMPKLEKFRFNVWARTLGSLDSNFYEGLQNMACLKNLVIEVDCREARAEQVEATEVAAKNAIANNHLPDHLNVQMRRTNVDRMIKDTVMGNSVVEQQEETAVKIHYN
uniref:NB-ARC domain-containing protein n=1 Tax=Oryza rufipogon TaxID=4529 RepID=A0A0E0R6W9_ORYRU